MKRCAQEFEGQLVLSAKRSKYGGDKEKQGGLLMGYTQSMPASTMQKELRAIEQEVGPLGLKLRKTPSLLDLVHVSLCMQRLQQPTPRAQTSSSSVDKRKATNFSAASLKIGAWEFISRYECDLVVKCYYAKRKLVWEVLEGGLKSKIEIQWSDISSLSASFPDNQHSMLEIELSRPPMFYKESNPQPRKHTIWQSTSDFTGGQATTFKRHVLQFPYGVFDKHYESLLQADERLNKLSRKPLCDKTPYFYSRIGGAGFHQLQQQEPYLSVLRSTMPSLFQSPNYHQMSRPSQLHTLRETNEEQQQEYKTYNLMHNMVDNGRQMRRPSSSASESTGVSDGASGSPVHQEMLDDFADYLLDDVRLEGHNGEGSLLQNQWTNVQQQSYATSFMNHCRPLDFDTEWHSINM